MALNAVHNERLESTDLLLRNLVDVVSFLLESSSKRHSLFVGGVGLENLHKRVKAILKHGAKFKHHLIFGQPSFAAFDVWLEERLIGHYGYTLLEELKDISLFYYDWAFLRDAELFKKFLECLFILGTRDLESLCDMEIYTREIESRSKIFEVQEQFKGAQETSVDETQLLSKEYTAGTSEIEVTSDYDGEDETSGISIPSFSYASVSPIASPPEFSGLYQSSGSSSSAKPRLNKTVPEFMSSTYLEEDAKSNSVSFHFDKSPVKPMQSFLEGCVVQPPALGNFPLPQKGQSLTSFLSSLSETMPELDRENAHFNVSEALISAFEKLRNRNPGFGNDLNNSDSGENVQVNNSEDVFGSVPKDEFSEFKLTEPDSTRKFDRCSKHFPRTPVTYTETEESEVEYPRHPPSHLKKKARNDLRSHDQSSTILSSNHISTSTSPPSSTEDEIADSSSFSAENVALRLLRNAKMEDHFLQSPASELKWCLENVSENDVPQSLLPLPKNFSTYSASESEIDCSDKLDASMRLRGTRDWAPPRPQIIFNVHPSPKWNVLTDTQKYRCAGCGMRVDVKYMATFRYCFYLGRYFCTGCHTGKKARIPQLILHKWDFSPYLVSNFSYNLLQSLQSDPVYNVLAINPNLSKKVKLNNFRNYRIQLGFLNDYLANCKVAETLHQDFLKFPSYYTADVDICSLEDLINVRFSTGMPMVLKEFIPVAIHHVLNCQLCQNLGFICELCSRIEIIFPFQINRVSRCSKCSTCFHLKCFNSYLMDCPKCLRITKRRNTLEVLPASIAV